MRERVKLFTHFSGHGETIAEPPLEERINQWLAAVNGEFVHISQSESEHTGAGHQVTVCIWYIPAESAP